jgi:hypothetical protein
MNLKRWSPFGKTFLPSRSRSKSSRHRRLGAGEEEDAVHLLDVEIPEEEEEGETRFAEDLVGEDLDGQWVLVDVEEKVVVVRGGNLLQRRLRLLVQ